MTPEQIKRAKRLTEILELTTHEVHTIDGIELLVTESGDEFNPEQDKALLWDLQMQYQIEVHHDYSNCVAYKDGYQIAMQHIEKEDAPAALIDCAIEINGGYDD